MTGIGLVSHTLRVAVALALLGAAPALAQDASMPQSSVPEELQSMVSDWMLEQEDESLPKCPLVFTDRQASGGWAVEVPEPCPAPFPPADQLAAWNVDDTDGSVLLMNAERKVVMRLLEDEDGLFDTAPDTEPRFYLLIPYDEDNSGGEADE